MIVGSLLFTRDLPEERLVATSARQFIRYALSIGAFQFPPGGFTLKGGRNSPYLFNSGAFCTGESIGVLARAYASMIRGHFRPPAAVFGSAYKGIPIVTALAQVLGGTVGYAFNRKERKNHDEGGIVVGAALEGKEVLIVDDAVTSGSSVREAFMIIKAAGGIPIGCAAAFDRQEIGDDGSQSAIQELKQDFGMDVLAIASLTDLLNEIEDGPNLDKLLTYRRLYGAA